MKKVVLMISLFVVLMSVFGSVCAQDTNLPAFKVSNVVPDEKVVLTTKNFPAETGYTVSMSSADAPESFTAVAKFNSKNGGSLNVTIKIPEKFQGQNVINLMLKDNNGGKILGNFVNIPEEPAAETPEEEPAAEEPAAETPEQEPAAEEPAAETPEHEPAAEEPAAETPEHEPAAEEPAAETPEEEPAAEEPAAETPEEEPAAEENLITLTNQTPAEEPAAETPEEEPAAEEPADETPEEEPAAEENLITLTNQAPAEEPAAEEQNEEPAEEEPITLVNQATTAEEPAAETSAEEPAAEEPAPETPEEEPVAEEEISAETPEEEPVTEEPADETPIEEQAAVQEVQPKVCNYALVPYVTVNAVQKDNSVTFTTADFPADSTFSVSMGIYVSTWTPDPVRPHHHKHYHYNNPFVPQPAPHFHSIDNEPETGKGKHEAKGTYTSSFSGVEVGTFNTGSGEPQTLTYEIPESIKGNGIIAIWIQDLGECGFYSYNYFYNNSTN